MTRDERQKPRPPDLGNREQVRRLRQAMDRSAEQVLRCQKCGHQQHAEAAMIGPLTTCEKCGTPLHSCTHCVHFDTSRASHCRKEIRLAVGAAAANECEDFRPRLVLDATGKRLGGKTSRDAKSAFDSLFKDS